MTRRLALLTLLGTLGAAATPGCSDDAGRQLDEGAAAVASNACAGCHAGALGPLGGSDDPIKGTTAFGPNLTFDPGTGLGSWSDEQVVRAIREGVDDEGAALCPTMPRFSTMSDAEARAVVAYLRSLEPVAHATPPSVCAVDEDVPTMPVDAVVADAAPPADAGLDAGSEAGVDAAADSGARDAAATDGGFDAGARDVPRDTGARFDTGAADTGARVDTGARADAGASGCHPVINELVTGLDGNGGSEWIELYNPCPTAISLTGWRLGYRAASSTSPLSSTDSSTLFAFASQRMAAGAYLLLGSDGYRGTVDARLSSGLADVGGVGLRNVAGTVLDSVGWGSTRNAFVRGRVAPAPPAAAAPGNSIQRLPDGADTGDNSVDFQVSRTPTPRAANR